MKLLIIIILFVLNIEFSRSEEEIDNYINSVAEMNKKTRKNESGRNKKLLNKVIEILTVAKVGDEIIVLKDEKIHDEDLKSLNEDLKSLNAGSLLGWIKNSWIVEDSESEIFCEFTIPGLSEKEVRVFLMYYDPRNKSDRATLLRIESSHASFEMESEIDENNILQKSLIQLQAKRINQKGK